LTAWHELENSLKSLGHQPNHLRFGWLLLVSVIDLNKAIKRIQRVILELCIHKKLDEIVQEKLGNLG